MIFENWIWPAEVRDLRYDFAKDIYQVLVFDKTNAAAGATWTDVPREILMPIDLLLFFRMPLYRPGTRPRFFLPLSSN